MSGFFVQAAGGGPHEVHIMDNIGESHWEEGITAKSIVQMLSAVDENDDILVRVNCRGGSTQEGTVIYNALADRPGKVVCRIEGYSCSMATVVMLAANEVTAYETAMAMTHKASTATWGNADDMRAAAEMLDKVDATLATAYARKLNCSAEEAGKLLTGDRDKWHTAAEMKEMGLIDEVIVPQKFNVLLDKTASAVLGGEGAAVVAAEQLPKDWQMFLQAMPGVVALKIGDGQMEPVLAGAKPPKAENTPADPPADDVPGDTNVSDQVPPVAEVKPPVESAATIVAAERKRWADITAMASKNNVDPSGDFVQGLIDSGVSAQMAGKQMLAVRAEISNQAPPSGQVSTPVASDSSADDGWASAYKK